MIGVRCGPHCPLASSCGCRGSSAMSSTRSRALTSTRSPAGNGMMTLIGRVGRVCAKTLSREAARTHACQVAKSYPASTMTTGVRRASQVCSLGLIPQPMRPHASRWRPQDLLCRGRGILRACQQAWSARRVHACIANGLAVFGCFPGCDMASASVTRMYQTGSLRLLVLLICSG